MKFEEAFEKFKMGYKIRRKAWSEKSYFCFEESDKRCIDINSSDVLSNDWEVIE